MHTCTRFLGAPRAASSLFRYNASVPDSSSDKPGQSTIEAALAAGDTALLRKLASERKGLTDQQRSALLLVADLLDRAGSRHPGQA